MSTDDAPDHGALFASYEDSLTPDERAREEGRRAVNAAILRMAGAAGAPLHERPIVPDSAITVTDTDPLSGIGFALMLDGAARQKLYHYITLARQEGASWRDVGRALHLERVAEERGASLGEAAFEYAAGEPSQPYDRLWFSWTCPACQGHVIDYGPYDHPADCERGHGEGCRRLAAAVAAWGAQWADED